jgi:hypothetical protein
MPPAGIGSQNATRTERPERDWEGVFGDTLLPGDAGNDVTIAQGAGDYASGTVRTPGEGGCS